LLKPIRKDRNTDFDFPISAIVPNYNHAQIVERAIRALAEQTLPPQEIVVVDDGSTDNSLAVLNALSREIPALRVVRHDTNRGAIAALNTGMFEAQGEWIYLGSADDFVEPDFFERAWSVLRATGGARMLASGCRIVDPSGAEIALRPPVLPSFRPWFFSPADTARLLRRIDNFLPTSGCLFRRDEAGYINGMKKNLESFADGYMLRVLALTHGFCYMPGIAANWTFDEGGYSVRTAGDSAAALRVMTLAKAEMQQELVVPDFYPRLFERRWRFANTRRALELKDVDRHALAPLAAPSAMDRFVWRMVASLPGRHGVFAAVIWLTLRFRPQSFRFLVSSFLYRRIRRGEA